MEPIEKLLPHTGKMRLLSRVKAIDINERSLCAEVDIAPSSFFYEHAMNGVPVWIGFEYMAQSIAALSGKWDLEHGIEPKMGFILSVKDFNAKANCFSEGTTVSIFVKELLRLEPVVSFECSIALNETVLATAMMNTIKIENIENFIEKEAKL